MPFPVFIDTKTHVKVRIGACQIYSQQNTFAKALLDAHHHSHLDNPDQGKL